MVENGWTRIFLGSALVGVVCFCVSWFLFARVKDSMDGIRVVYIGLFSIALSVVICIISSIVYWVMKRS